MQQQQTQMQKRKGVMPSRGLNKDVPPISIRTKNNMKSSMIKNKSFKAKRRVESSPTNMSPKAVSKPTKGAPAMSAGNRMMTKTYKHPRVVQANAQQQSMNSSPALTKAPSMQPANAKMKTKRAPGLPRSYSSIHKSVRKTMGY